MSLTSDQAALIADRERIWEVRRFCQVRSANPPSACGEDSTGDAALSALVRCLMYELDADLAAITLLDETTQHFLTVVHRKSLHDPTIQSTKWYGCEQIAHRGGICQQTVTIESMLGPHPVYEILDLSADESTKTLPIVDGSAGDFRHYAGVPLTTSSGQNLGTMFVFRNEAPIERLSPAKCAFMWQTARQAMTQMEQTLAATENERALRCNNAVASMLESHVTTAAMQTPRAEKSPRLYTSFAQTIYTSAVNLLCHAFELEGCIIQELPISKPAANVSQPQGDRLLAYKSMSGTIPAPTRDSVAEMLLHNYPSGAIFHVLSTDSDGKFSASVQRSPGSQEKITLDLHDEFPPAEQFMFMPLRDSFHDRDVAFMLGWAHKFDRVYSSTTDLPPFSSFGAAVMTQVRRLEAQMLSRNKSDFLGSMSHEMRSPLHGMLACIELLLQDTSCSDHQLDLLESAEACGLQLRGNIDNILLYSNIGSASPRSDATDHNNPMDSTQDLQHRGNNMLALIEDTIGRDARKRKGTMSSKQAPKNLLWTNDNRTSNHDPHSISTVITVDADPLANFPLARYSGISVIISNLLSNCIKFTGADACIRIRLEVADDNVILSFLDAGRGMTTDFVKHNLLVPFAQQNPLDAGTGLGLSLVQSAVQALGGETKIDTDESKGTEVIVSLPRSRLACNNDKESGSMSEESSGEKQDFSSFTARLLTPSRWQDLENPRHQRSLDALTFSLSRTLRTWVNMDFCALETSDEMPDVMFVLHTDIERLQAVAKESFNAMGKIVMCPDLQAEAEVLKMNLNAATTTVGPITSSKVYAAMSACLEGFPSRQSSTVGSTPASSTEGIVDGIEANSDEAHPTPTQSPAAEPERGTEAVESEGHGLGIELPNRSRAKSIQQPVEPRFLLVDDNAINLKVVGMYAKKCSKQPSVSAGGGQEAIDAFKAAVSLPTPGDDGTAPVGFDIILLDLSMPEVSGFDVAAAVRKHERESGSKGTYIAALTGLVSDKDRDAAFAAGVDEYVTKPATLKDVKGVVANWKAVSEMPS